MNNRCFKNVYTWERGMVFDEKYQLIPEASPHYGAWKNQKFELEQLSLKFQEQLFLQKNKVEKIEGHNFISIMPYWNIYPYAHLFDHLQGLIDFENIEDKYLVCIKNNGWVVDLPLHFNFVGYNNTVELDYTKIYFFSQIYIPSLYSSPGTFQNEKVISWLRDKYIFKNNSIDIEKIKVNTTKLYLSRTQTRKVINEEEVWNYLKQNGFIKITGKESLIQQIYNFSCAEVIIGPHGGLFANNIFCIKKPMIHEFCPSNRKNSCFLDLTSKLKIPHFQHLVDGDSQYNIKIDLNDLKKIIEEKEKK